jgi:hypothetical protein
MGLVAPVVPVVPRLAGRAGPVELVLAGLGDRVELMGLVVPVVLDRVELGQVDPELPDLMGRVDLGHLASRVVLVAMGPLDRAAPVDLVQTGLANRVGLMSRVDREAPVGLEAPANPEAPDLTGRAALVDRHLRRTSNTVSTTAAARSGAAPGTHRTGSARRITARLLLRGNAATGGTTDLLPAVRRPTGMAHRLLAVGTGRRLLAAGIVDGMGRLATSVSHSPISDHLATAASMPYRSSTRSSVDGASGSSATGYPSTDLNAPSRTGLPSSRY